MSKSGVGKEEWSSVQHALAYLNVADNLPHRTEGAPFVRTLQNLFVR